jgi:hypothetical protein
LIGRCFVFPSCLVLVTSGPDPSPLCRGGHYYTLAVLRDDGRLGWLERAAEELQGWVKLGYAA